MRKIRILHFSLLLLVAAWNQIAHAQLTCTWETLPSSELPNVVARAREDLKVLRSEVFTFADNSVYHVYLCEDGLVYATPFNSGTWNVAATVQPDPYNAPDKPYAIAAATVAGVKRIVVGASNGIFSLNLNTGVWGYNPGTLSASIQPNVHDMIVDPANGDLYVLHQPTVATLRIEKYSAGSWTDFGLAADATQNIITKVKTFPTDPPANNAVNRINTSLYKPQLMMYGSANLLVGYCIDNSFASQSFPRAMRYNGTSWSKVTNLIGGSQQESLIMGDYTPVGFGNSWAENNRYEMQLSVWGNGSRAYIRVGEPILSSVPLSGNYLLVDAGANTATNISTPTIPNNAGFFSNTTDAANNLYSIYFNGAVKEMSKYDISAGTWSTIGSFPYTAAQSQTVFSGTEIYVLNGGLRAGGNFYNSTKPNRTAFTTTKLTGAIIPTETTHWMNNAGLAGTASKLFTGPGGNPMIAYADSMYSDSSYRIKIQQWDGLNWSPSIMVANFNTTLIKDFDISFNNGRYILAVVEPSGDSKLYSGDANGWTNIFQITAAATDGVARFVRLSDNGNRMMVSTKLGSVYKIKYGYYDLNSFGFTLAGDVYSGPLALENKYQMEPVLANGTDLAFVSGAGIRFCKSHNGSAWATWSTAFNTDFAVNTWFGFDVTATPNTIHVAYNNMTATKYVTGGLTPAGTYTSMSATQMPAIPAAYNLDHAALRINMELAEDVVYLGTWNTSHAQTLVIGNLSTMAWDGTEITNTIQVRNTDFAYSHYNGLMIKYGSSNITVRHNLTNVTTSVSGMAACPGSDVELVAYPTANGSSSWTGPNGYTSDNDTAFISNFSAAMSGAYYYTTKDTVYGCGVRMQGAAVSVATLPAVEAYSDDTMTVCLNSSFTLAGSGADTYTWDNGVTDGASMTASATGSTTYIVTGTSTSTGCSATDTVVVTVPVVAAPAGDTSYIPLSLTGFNHDIVANGNNYLTSTTTSVDSDADGCRFIDATYTQFGTPTRYLPTGGAFMSQNPATPTLPFQLASYTSNNSLALLTDMQTGTLTLTTPTKMTGFYFLGTGGGGGTYMEATVTFTDNTTENFTYLYVDDWFNGESYAMLGTGRMYNNALGFQAPTDVNPRLYQYLINLAPANTSKTVASVTFLRNGGGAQKIQIMGMTALVVSQTFCSSEMATVSDLGATGSNLTWYAAATGGTALPANTALTTGTYYGTQVVDGCESTSRMEVPVTVATSPSRTITATSCGSYTFNGTTYTTSGTYMQSVAAPSGCDSLITINLTVNALPSDAFTFSNDTICDGATVTITDAAGFVNNWEDPIVVSGMAFEPQSIEQNYFVVTSTNTTTGCVANDTLLVYVMESPRNYIGTSYNVVTTTPTSCTANTGTAAVQYLNGGSTFTYLWAGGETSATLSNLAAGAYSVTITNELGCSAVFNGTVSALGAPSITAGTPTEILCNGDLTGSASITATGGQAPYTYSWTNDPSTTNAISNVGAGTYTVTVTDANNCSAVETFTISEPAALTINGTAADVSCGGAADGSVMVNIGGGVMPYSYDWSNGGTTQDLTNISGGTYELEITDANGCMLQSASYTVNEAAAIVVTSAITNSDCGQSNGAVDITATGGTGTLNFAWASGQTTEDLTNVSAGSYEITVTDAAGCTETDTYNVNSIGGPVVDGSVIDASCSTSQDGSVDLIVTGTGPFTYSWSNGATTEDLSAVAPGTYTVEVNNAQNCPSFSTFTVGGSVFTVGVTQNGAVLTADVNGAAYQWIDCATGLEVTGETAQTFNVQANGSYAVVATNGQCSDTSACVTITDLSVSDLTVKSLQVFPNPGTGLYHVVVSEAMDLVISDAYGKILGTVQVTAGENNIDLTNEATGVYFITVKNMSGQTVRLIKN